MGEQSVSDLTVEGLVHDLNNVFETVNEAAELLVADPKWERLGRTLQRSVTLGRSLVSGYRETALGRVEFALALDAAVHFVSDFLQLAHGPAIEFHRECEEGILLEGAPADWERVLVNLLMNCVQAMKGGGAIEVSAAKADGCAKITVSDNGPGIDPEILPRIFEPHVSTKEKQGGLGLHIVDSIVRKYGGNVRAANRLSAAGAAISIEIPCN